MESRGSDNNLRVNNLDVKAQSSGFVSLACTWESQGEILSAALIEARSMFKLSSTISTQHRGYFGPRPYPTNK